MNHNIILGGLIFLLWGFFSTWYYTCQIKGLCMAEVQSITTLREQPPPENITSIDTLSVTPPDTAEEPTAIDLSNANILFTKNTAQLTNERSLIDFLSKARDESKDREVQLAVTGHTCDLGTDPHNERLGMERALSMKGFLQKHGFANGQTTYQSMGETTPLKPNDSEENRKKNRRVEITIKSTDQ